MIHNVLTIAGSDPSGGAGIQADLKTLSACGAYGMAVITALTAQNTQGVTAVHTVPADFVADQIKAIFDDIRVDAVKIGMIANAEIAQAIADALEPHKGIPLVLDPVMIAKGGASLLEPDTIELLRTRLVPLATLITPNLPEAAALLDQEMATDRKTMAMQAVALRELGADCALVKGGHLTAEDSPDVLSEPQDLFWFEGRRIDTPNTHGSGCTLSSAIAAYVSRGYELGQAVAWSKTYLSCAISAAHRLSVGSGHGPVHHNCTLWVKSGNP